MLHTHSIWSTLLSERHGDAGGVVIEGYEMLKGLEGVRTHEHREWLPIVENDQDMAAAVRRRTRRARRSIRPRTASCCAGHGLYTWGADLPQAVRHVEILEFLMEIDRDEAAAASRRSSQLERARWLREHDKQTQLSLEHLGGATHGRREDSV